MHTYLNNISKKTYNQKCKYFLNCKDCKKYKKCKNDAVKGCQKCKKCKKTKQKKTVTLL